MDFLADLRYGARQLRHAPAYTAAAVLALGLGAGATTAIFTVLDAVVLRPLPYASPERLVMLWETNRAKQLEHEPLSPVNFMDYRGLSQVFTDAAAWWRPDFTLTLEGQDPVRVNAVEASTNFFAVLGVKPFRGPGFGDNAAFYDRTREVAISHRLWQTRFAGDERLVGTTIRLNNQAYTVTGIMPQGFNYPGDTDVWQRLQWDLTQHSRAAHFMEAVARLRDGVTLERAQLELAALTTRLARENARTNSGWSAYAVPLHHEVVGFYRPALYVLLGAVVLLLAIACVNVASLLLARGAAREREVAIRAAIGATETRLVRQFLTESVLLSCAGGLLGIALAAAGVRVLVHAAPIAIPRATEIAIDARVLGFALSVTLATAIAFGLMPALFLARTDLQQTLKETGRSAIGAGRARARRLLVVAEVALAVMLLFGSGLLIRTVANLAREDPGFDPSGALTAGVQTPAAAYPKWEQVATFYGALIDRIRQSPQVRYAGAANVLPLAPGWRIPFLIKGRPAPARGEEPQAQYHSASDGYFEALGAHVVAGRSFDAHDTAESEPVVMINETLARQFFAGEDPVGRTITSFSTAIGPLGRTLMTSRDHRIIGVVRDVKNHSLQSATEPAIYNTVRQYPFRTMFLVLRGAGDSGQLTSVVRDALRAMDPAMPLSNVRTLGTVVGQSVQQPRFLTYLVSAFASLALLLAALGIYGMLAYVVGQRRQEISVRLALGASRSAVLWLVLRQGLLLAIVGVVVGAAAGLVATRIASRLSADLLYGIGAADVPTLAIVVTMMLGVAAAACLIPARRASALNPLAGLRAE